MTTTRKTALPVRDAAKSRARLALACGATLTALLVAAWTLRAPADEHNARAASAAAEAPAENVAAPTAHAPLRAVDPAFAPATVAPADTAVADPVALVREASRDRSPSGTAALRRALEEEDAIARIEAIDALVARKDTAAIALLAQKKLDDDDLAARSVVAGLGALAGASSDANARKVAVDRLVALLEEEHAKATPDQGNLLVLIEALGETNDHAAAPALEKELGRKSLDATHLTTAVQALGKVGTNENVPALDRVRALAAALPAKDSYERGLRRELVTAIVEVRKHLSEVP